MSDLKGLLDETIKEVSPEFCNAAKCRFLQRTMAQHIDRLNWAIMSPDLLEKWGDPLPGDPSFGVSK